jgi:hypothetical protein
VAAHGKIGAVNSRLAILLCAGWAVPATAVPLAVPLGAPAGFALDGKVAEWRGEPSWRLPGARIWFAVEEDAFLLVGEVLDDDPVLSAGGEQVVFWLGLPPAIPPPIEFDKGWGGGGPEEVPDEAACSALAGSVLEGPDDVESCRESVRGQLAQRAMLGKRFLHAYRLTPDGGVREVHAVRELPASAAVVFASAKGGYAFEARLPLQAWPAFAQLPLRELRLALDLGDAGPAGLRWTTSRPGHLAGEEGLEPALLDRPLAPAEAPPFLEHLLAGRPHLYVAAGTPHFRVIDLDGPDGYPEELALPEKPIFDTGERSLWLLPVSHRGFSDLQDMRWFNLEGRRLVEESDAGVSCGHGAQQVLIHRAAPGEACDLVLLGCQEPESLSSGGPCGICPVLSFDLRGWGADGRLREIRFSPFDTQPHTLITGLGAVDGGFKVYGRDWHDSEEGVPPLENAFTWAGFAAACVAPDPDGHLSGE